MKLIICLSCKDQIGIVSKLTTEIAKYNANILTAEQFTDNEQKEFYCRIVVEIKNIAKRALLEKNLKKIEIDLKGKLILKETTQKERVVILASKASHCLAELLWRQSEGELNMELVGVMANHQELKQITEKFGQRFYYIGINNEKDLRSVEDKINELNPETIVMARFMRILTPIFCAQRYGKIINIHHSFLPSFVGAKPYHQAKKRGVKLIGATCHYATKDIDQGPIIEQNVVRAEHYHSVKDLIKLGQDCEKLTLSQGLKLHLENRIFIHNNQTIIFRH